jgi:hypothetical protein
MLSAIEKLIKQRIEPQLDAYFELWLRLSDELGLRDAVPSALGIKVADRAAFNSVLSLLIGRSDQVHIGTVDRRKIAMAVLNEPIKGVPIFKLMERRPSSEDPTGFDHVDFYFKGTLPDTDYISAFGYKPEWQKNDAHRWLSIRFGSARQFEAKLVDHTVLHVGQRELRDAEKRILARNA